MFKVAVILGSVRRGRQSPAAAHYVIQRLTESGRFSPELIDLAEYDLPIMEERLHVRDDAPASVRLMGEKLMQADAIVVVTPEYNNGYPGVLKNAIDYFLPEFKRKPVGIVTTSSGPFGGINALAQLRQVFMLVGAYPLPARLPIPFIQDAFDDKQLPKDAGVVKTTTRFLDELLWLTEAVVAKKQLDAGNNRQ